MVTYWLSGLANKFDTILIVGKYRLFTIGNKDLQNRVQKLKRGCTNEKIMTYEQVSCGVFFNEG